MSLLLDPVFDRDLSRPGAKTGWSSGPTAAPGQAPALMVRDRR